MAKNNYHARVTKHDYHSRDTKNNYHERDTVTHNTEADLANEVKTNQVTTGPTTSRR